MENRRIKLATNLGLIPDVLEYLASIKEFEYSYKKYKLRHPGGIFNLATTCVIEDFIELLDELKVHQKNFEKESKKELEEKFRKLINEFFKFYESCFEIIQGCCKEHEPPIENEVLWKWLKKNGYNGGQYLYNNMKKDLEYFRKLNNKLKHTSNILNSLMAHNGKSAIMGYFLESVSDDGSIGPDEELHPKSQNTHSASSYNFSLRRLYYCFYKIADLLKEVLLLHFKQVYDIEFKPNHGYKADDKKWRELFEKICELPSVYFPSELNQDANELKLEENVLVFTIKRAEKIMPFGSQLTFIGSGNGFTRSYRLPFFTPR